MKQPWFVLIAVLLFTAVPSFAQQQTAALEIAPLPASASSRATSAPYGAPEDRLFFPRHWIRGHTDFAIAPSHNEPDLGRCSPLPAANFGGAASQCTAFARWVISGYVELQPIGRTFLRHVYVFYDTQFFFGRNVPQYSYTLSFEGMADERSFGVAMELPKHFEVRLTTHRSDWLGRYAGHLGPADLSTHPPYGNNATVGLRWNFGGWGHEEE